MLEKTFFCIAPPPPELVNDTWLICLRWSMILLAIVLTFQLIRSEDKLLWDLPPETHIITNNINIFSLSCNSGQGFVGCRCIQAGGSAWKSRRYKAFSSWRLIRHTQVEPQPVISCKPEETEQLVKLQVSLGWLWISISSIWTKLSVWS